MTPKQRMLAVMNGDRPDEIPFVEYVGMIPRGAEEIWRHVDIKDVGGLAWVGAWDTDAPNCKLESVETEEDGQDVIRSSLVTPKGTLTGVMVRNVVKRKPMVTDIKDYHVLLAYLRDLRYTGTTAHIEQVLADLGDQGLPHVKIPRTPYQRLWTEYVSMEDLAIHMQDAPELVDEVMRELGRHVIDAAKVTAMAARETEFYHAIICDNITAPMIGPTLFAKWCAPYYNEVSDILAEEGIKLMIHMDGDLKPLWHEIAKCRHAGIDSMSPPPDNDTSVTDAFEQWPDKLVWTNFPSSVHLAEPAEVYSVACTLLEQGGHTGRFWIQITEDLPWRGGQWWLTVPEIVKAIRDFGKP